MTKNETRGEWKARITSDNEVLLTYTRDGEELASVNQDPYPGTDGLDEYVALFGDGQATADYDRMQMFGSLGDAQQYILDELEGP
jgi:hypothetical protein